MSSYIFRTINDTVDLGTGTYPDLDRVSYPSPLTITFSGVVTPSDYGYSGVYSKTAGVVLTNEGLVSGAYGGSGGYTGGIGVDLTKAATVTNAGRIYGGGGGDGYSGYPTGGNGGVGVSLAGGTLSNTSNGVIVGGAAGATTANESGDNGGMGGKGVVVSGGTVVTNAGHITGGAGGNSQYGKGGAGGIGVYLDGGTLVTSGAIAGGAAGSGPGGNGKAGYAVKFGAVASTLEVESGASFTGFVVADPAVNDTLETGGTVAGVLPEVGELFQGFSTVKFAPGSYWTVQTVLNPGVFGGAGDDHLTVDLTPGNIFEFTNVPFSEVPGPTIHGSNAYFTIDGVTTEFVGVSKPGEIFTTEGAGATTSEFFVTQTLSTTNPNNVTLGKGGYYGALYIVPSGTVDPSTGTGVTSDTSGGTLKNAGTIDGGDGGNGVTLGGGDTLTNTNGGTIDGGSGGDGVDQAGGTLANDGTIDGGSGGAGVDDNGGDDTNSGNGVIDGGENGDGVDQTGGALDNDGTVNGGSGGVGLDDNGGDDTNGGTIDGGDDGDGADVGGNGDLANQGTIQSGSGGTGVDLNGGSLTNTGTITGGGTGGMGVDVTGGGTVTNNGTISAAPANEFIPQMIDMSLGGPAPETLVVQPAAVFNGQVDADYGTYDNDTLGLDAGYYDPTLSGFGTQFTGFATLDFMSGQWTVNSTTAAVDGAAFQITGFAAGDELHLTDLTLNAGATYAFNNGVLQIQDPGVGTIDINFSNTDGTNFSVVADSNGGTDISIACYRRGTRILTDRGEVPIESLRIGDHVTTRTGAPRPIRWIGRRSYARDVAWGDPDVLPILIRRGALDDAVPKRDLWVSPEHAMYIDGMLIPAVLLVNGMSIVQERRPREVTYFHLEFDTHDVIVAEGALSESFVDDDSRAMFDNASEYPQLYPDAAAELARFCAPRVDEGYELEVVRQRLAARAEMTYRTQLRA